MYGNWNYTERILLKESIPNFNTEICVRLASSYDINSKQHPNISAQLSSTSELLLYEPRVTLEDNTMSTTLDDGGG